MMNFDEFKQQVADEIKDYLPKEFENAEVSLTKVLKNNDVELDAIIVKQEDVNIAPTIYLRGFFDDYQKGTSMESILEEIAKVNVDHAQSKDFDVSRITDFELVKDKIMPRLVNADGNAERLAGSPHTEVEDLSVIYTVELAKMGDGMATVTVSDQLMEKWGIDKEQLHDLAIKNLADHGNPVLTDMRTVMVELMAEEMSQMGMSKEDAINYVKEMIPDDSVPMYVVTNEEKIHGASVLLNQDFMDSVADKLGGDYFILPSSVHECICIPKNEDMNFRDFEGMVHEVNTNEVRPEDRLSEHVYEYDAKEHELMRSDRAEERRAERAKEEKTHERISIKDKLAEKKIEAAKQQPKVPNKDRSHSVALG